MPANLTPQYRKAEEEYRKAQTPAEQVECLQLMLRLIPKHKGTDHLQADLKKRLKEAKAETEAEKNSPKKGPSYRFPRQGAGQVANRLLRGVCGLSSDSPIVHPSGSPKAGRGGS